MNFAACPRRLALATPLLALALLPFPQGAAAKLRSYQLDPVHTRIAFQVSHAGFSRPVGSFSGASGTLQFDDKDWRTGKVDIRIPLRTLDLGDADWQRKILDRTFFDAAKFPEARFVSARVEPTGARSANVFGDLTMRGVTHPVTLQVTLNALARHPLTLKKTAGFSASGVLSRKQFGMDAWRSVVGDDVTLIIEAEAVRDNDADEEAGDADRK